ncbi:MAG: nucleoside diphosphate kinase regulator [Pseudomonadota bacterium]|jgi:regulator of nucleoside diphosphate kinase|nr:MAG: nucleoside diphosphate kinase regulator [Pseudomonadota bacterium]
MQYQTSGAASLPPIIIPAGDYDRLMDLAGAAERLAPDVADYLTRELTRAQVVPDQEFDAAVARVGSLVTYIDEPGGQRRTVKLVWPMEASLPDNRISVLTSIGAALLGMRAGQSIDWPSPVGGARRLTVVDVQAPRNTEPMPDRAA